MNQEGYWSALGRLFHSGTSQIIGLGLEAINMGMIDLNRQIVELIATKSMA